MSPLQDEILADIDDELLVSEQEKSLVKQLAQFPESVQAAADQLAPHIIVNYLRELASSFSSFFITRIRFLYLNLKCGMHDSS